VLGDTVSYAGRTDPITASIADDGPADADGDVVPRQFDNLTGGDGGDDLTGDIDPNHLRGGLGADHLDVTRGGLPDIADCGDGVDTALGDSAALDTMIACEATTFLENPPVPPVVPPPPPATGTPGGGAAGTSNGAASAAALKKCKKKKGAKRKKCRKRALRLAV
jgi:Ca2+-binding RTX toxin-like protein